MLDYKYRKQVRPLYFEILVKELKKFNPKIVLDIGCAEGLLIRMWRRYGIDAYGCDLSSRNISLEEKSRLILCDIENSSHLPFKDQTFDMITAIEVLEHISNVRGVIKEFNRILKPNGLVFMTTPTPIEQSVRTLFGKACKEHVTIKPKQFWLKEFEQEGFRQENFEATYYKVVEKYLLNLTSVYSGGLKIARIAAKLKILRILLPYWKNVALLRKIDDI